MKRELFEKWIPHENVDLVYDMENIEWKNCKLELSLFPDNLDHNMRSMHKLKLIWDDILCYQVTKESYCPDLWISDSDEAWTFYTSTSSEFLTDFKKDNILAPENVFHFLVIGTNFVINILSVVYPTVVFY